MKNLYLLVLSTLCILTINCSTNQPTVNVTGADSDSHGCKASAGYHWSNLKKECIRVFELPIQLSNSDNSFSAGVVFSADSKQAEVFTKDGDFILKKQSEKNYSNGSVFLKENAGKWEFGNVKDGKAEYKQ